MALFTVLPRWANSGGVVVEPLESKKNVGWVAGEKPPAEYFNWLFKTIYDAFVIVDGLENRAMTWAAAHAFNAAVTMAQTLGVAGKFTANGGQDLGGNLALISAVAQTLLKTGAGGLRLGTGAGGGDLELQREGTTFLKKGTSGAIDLFSNWFTNLADPSLPQHAATKAYVDGKTWNLSRTQMALNANWSAITDAEPAYWKDPFGVVHLTGIAQASAGAGGAIFNMPAGYRPAKDITYSTHYTNGGATQHDLLYLDNSTFDLKTQRTPAAADRYYLDGLAFATF